MFWIIGWLFKIEGFINKCIDFLLRKDRAAEVNQTIDNSKKKSIFDIQIGGKKEIYYIYEKYNPPKERLMEEVEVSDSTTSTASNIVKDDEEIESIINESLGIHLEK